MNSNRDISWLAQAVPTDLAYDAYQLATFLSHREPQIAAKLFEKSLSLPFTEKDEEKFRWHIARSFAMAPKIKNLEKQLRFWTKKALANVYSKNNQPQLAQLLVEELTAMDTSDIIQPAEVFGLAGQVQAASGQRVVESKILRDEAQKQDSPQYWVERAQYYRGRKENESVWQTLNAALAKFPYQAKDSNASAQRLQILRLFRWHGEYERKEEIKEVFRREFARAANDEQYMFALARIIGDDFDDFLEELFVNRELITRILAARPNWRQEETYLIKDAMEPAGWDAEKRERVWNQLTALARRDILNRAYSLADAMIDQKEYRKAVPLLEAALKIAPEDFQGGLNFNREYVERALFDAYIESGDWRSAEKMFLGGYKYWGNELGRIAVSAARNGNTAEAVRLWKLNANSNRGNLSGLEELAKTGAKPFLREFYLEMKKRDALTDVPDKALRLLQ
jgi:hypothetical protein